MADEFEREMTARLDAVVQQLDALATEHRQLSAQVKAVLRPVRRVPRWWESTEAQGLLRGVFLGAAVLSLTALCAFCYLKGAEKSEHDAACAATQNFVAVLQAQARHEGLGQATSFLSRGWQPSYCGHS